MAFKVVLFDLGLAFKVVLLFNLGLDFKLVFDLALDFKVVLLFDLGLDLVLQYANDFILPEESFSVEHIKSPLLFGIHFVCDSPLYLKGKIHLPLPILADLEANFFLDFGDINETPISLLFIYYIHINLLI